MEEGSVRRSSPIYFSPIHRPSTNPYFAIDARAGHDFPAGCDDVGHFISIEIWGKTLRRKSEDHGKAAKEKQSSEDYDWRLLDERNVDLDKLVPLPDDVGFLFTLLDSVS